MDDAAAPIAPTPVGVRTLTTGGASALTLEVWHPRAPAAAPAATPAFRLVRDAPLVGGPYPLLIYSHGGYGSRLNSNGLCSYLAAQGYMVAAPDHPGNTADDLERFL